MVSDKKPLKERLAEADARVEEMTTAFHREAVGRAVIELRRANSERSALQEGEIAPEFELATSSGDHALLLGYLNRGPVIVTFFRGSWCPYCEATLKAFQDSLEEFHELGAEVLAISLETPEENRRFAERLGLTFPLLSDPGGRVAKLFGVLYQVPPELAAAYRETGIDLPDRQASERWLLPLAASYVIDQDCVARYAIVEADPARRAEPADILATLKRL